MFQLRRGFTLLGYCVLLFEVFWKNINFLTSHEGNLSPPVARGNYLQFHVYCAQQWQAGKYPSIGVTTKFPHTTSFEILDTSTCRTFTY